MKNVLPVILLLIISACDFWGEVTPVPEGQTPVIEITGYNDSTLYVSSIQLGVDIQNSGYTSDDVVWTAQPAGAFDSSTHTVAVSGPGIVIITASLPDNTSDTITVRFEDFNLISPIGTCWEAYQYKRIWLYQGGTGHIQSYNSWGGWFTPPKIMVTWSTNNGRLLIHNSSTNYYDYTYRLQNGSLFIDEPNRTVEYKPVAD